MHLRIQQLRALLEEAGLGAALIHKPWNVRYLSGFTGDGFLLVTQQAATLFTNFLYEEHAQRQAKGCEIVTLSSALKLTDALPARLPGAVRLGFEDDYVTVAGQRTLAEALPGGEYAPLGGLPERVRRIKDAQEIDCLARAQSITARAFVQILPSIREGLTERALVRIIENALFDLGSEKVAFDTIACAGPNGSLPHAEPSDRPIQTGELITMDFGARVDGYCADMTRTVAMGRVSEELRRMYDTVLTAQLLSLDAIKPGVACCVVDGIARAHIDGAGYEGRFGHSLGHSVGLQIHEGPGLSSRDETPLAEGMSMTVEPGIYVPGVGGVRIEDMVMVVEGGCRNLTDAPKQLIEL